MSLESFFYRHPKPENPGDDNPSTRACIEGRDGCKELARIKGCYSLHDWMTSIWIGRANVSNNKLMEFNCERLYLTHSDLHDLCRDIDLKSFWYEPGDMDKFENDIREAIQAAFKELTDGYQVFYESWY